MALTEFQQRFLTDRDLQRFVPLIPEYDWEKIIPKNVEAAAHRQAYASYDLALRIIDELHSFKPHEVANVNRLVRGLVLRVSQDQRGPFKLTLNYLYALEIISIENHQVRVELTADEVINAKADLKRRLDSSRALYEQSQGETLMSDTLLNVSASEGMMREISDCWRRENMEKFRD